MATFPWMTSTDIINAVKRKIMMPVSQQTFSQSDILSFANEEMFISQVPGVLSMHSEYFVSYQTVPLLPNVSRYPIPNRAIGMKLRSLFWMDQNGNLAEMTQIHEEDRAYYQRATASNNNIHKFFFEGNDIVLSPGVGSNAQGQLVLVYYLRPNQMVKNDRACIIQNFVQTVKLNNSLISPYDTFTISADANSYGAVTNIPFTAITSGGGTITSITSLGPQTQLTASNHKLLTNQTIVISGSNCNPSIDGSYNVVSVIDSNNFVINKSIATSGNAGTFICKNQFVIGASSSLTAANLAASINSVALIQNASAINGVVTLSFLNIYTMLATTNPIAFSIPSNTFGIQFDQVPTSYTDQESNISETLYKNMGYVDFLQTKPGHKTYLYDIQIPSSGISGNVVTFNTSSLMVPTGTISSGIVTMLPALIPGDYMCVANECIIPQIPPDLHTGLAERTAARILAAMGDQVGLQASNAKIAEIEQRQGNLLSNRDDGNPQKVAARKTLLRAGKIGSWGRR